MHLWPLPEKTEETEPEDEETKAAREAAAHSAPERVKIDADDPRWVPPPTVVRDGVFGFPDSASKADDTYSLYLALFKIRFDENMQTAQVTAVLLRRRQADQKLRFLYFSTHPIHTTEATEMTRK